MINESLQKVLGLLTSRKRAYQLCFGSAAGNEVLMDLVLFCRAAETCVIAEKGKPVDRERTLILEGRREVWLRIQQHMKLTEEQLYALYNGRNILQPAKDDDDA